MRNRTPTGAIPSITSTYNSAGARGLNGLLQCVAFGSATTSAARGIERVDHSCPPARDAQVTATSEDSSVGRPHAIADRASASAACGSASAAHGNATAGAANATAADQNYSAHRSGAIVVRVDGAFHGLISAAGRQDGSAARFCRSAPGQDHWSPSGRCPAWHLNCHAGPAT